MYERQAINERVKEPVNGSFLSVNGKESNEKLYLKFVIFPFILFSQETIEKII